MTPSSPEIGENHVGDWNRAKDMIAAAAAAGADAVKFQSYLGTDVSDDDPEKEWFTQVQLPDALHFELKQLAERHGVEFLSSCFSVERARFLVEKLGLRRMKVASSELLNYPLLGYLNGRVETVYLSTGMATLDEVGDAVARLEAVQHVCVMQCTSLYPCPPEQANLTVIPTLTATFPTCTIGYSDHTVGILAPVVAVGLGAAVVEKHFNNPGPPQARFSGFRRPRDDRRVSRHDRALRVLGHVPAARLPRFLVSAVRGARALGTPPLRDPAVSVG